MSILYLRIPETFRIILRGEIVEHHNIADDLKYIEYILYKPQSGGSVEVLLLVPSIILVAYHCLSHWKIMNYMNRCSPNPMLHLKLITKTFIYVQINHPPLQFNIKLLNCLFIRWEQLMQILLEVTCVNMIVFHASLDGDCLNVSL